MKTSNLFKKNLLDNAIIDNILYLAYLYLKYSKHVKHVISCLEIFQHSSKT